MALIFDIRDLFKNPRRKIDKIDLQPGYTVLDYGCGTGSYSIPAAKVVGESGNIYAADIHPIAIEKVWNKAKKRGLNNITTILTDCETNLNENAIDRIILFDLFHNISDREKLLKELHRVLKPDGKLVVDDHHMDEDEIISEISKNGLFKYVEKKEKMYFFKII